MKGKLLRFLDIIERYFLGIKNSAAVAPPVQLIMGADSRSRLLSLIVNKHPEKPVLIVSQASEPIIGCPGLLIRPEYLEQVPLMMNETLQMAPLVVADLLSTLPSKTEHGSPICTKFDDFKELFAVFKWLKELHDDRKITLVVIEEEELLGQKNSALLGRIMNT